MTLVTPIVVVDVPSGDIRFFDSLESATTSIEPVDADSRDLRAFDSEGRLLHMEGTGRTTTMRPAESEPAHVDELRAALLQYIGFLSELVAHDVSLAYLVERARGGAGARRPPKPDRSRAPGAPLSGYEDSCHREVGVRWNEMATDPAGLESAVRSFLAEFLAEARIEGPATVTKRAVRDLGPGTAFTLSAADPLAANVTIAVGNGIDLLYVAIGEGTHLEIPLDSGRYTESRGLGELAEILRCVVDGGFSEVVWERRERRLLTVGLLSLRDRAVRVSNVRLPLIAKLIGRRRRVSYAPYPRRHVESSDPTAAERETGKEPPRTC